MAAELPTNMSLDIDWSLLTPSDLTSNLISRLNTQLETAPRPSFIGPISIASFDFGTVAPEVEIKDIRDVWRAFDEGDEEGDEVDAMSSSQAPPQYVSRKDLESSLDDEAYEVVNPSEAARYYAEDDGGLDDTSIYSGLASPRPSVAAVGIGLGSAAMHFGMGRDYASAIMSPHPGGAHPSLFSHPHVPSRRHRPSSAAIPLHSHTPPASPPARPAGLSESKSSIPSLQLHLKVDYASDMTLTLLTSLSINYPSVAFMSLPLKLSITGLTLAADVVVAYSGDKHRVHLCVIDEDDGTSAIPLGQRLLPNLTIDSEIGHADAHVLKNVGKVERFIADVVRKTLVDELVFPNFLTIAL